MPQGKQRPPRAPSRKAKEDLGCATRITFRQVEVGIGESAVVDHVKNGYVQTFDVEFAGGGGNKWLLRYATVEPLDDDELKAYRAEQAEAGQAD